MSFKANVILYLFPRSIATSSFAFYAFGPRKPCDPGFMREEKDWERRERSVGGDKRESDLATLIGFEEPGFGEAIVVATHGWGLS